ncbi:uncharacterized protein [Antedon mediterranea]|uniref:uncharacterized protein n=1 Tax=Antedon mediterranea TaxID=105859 RepID=UPI003AF6AC6B
MKTDPVSNTVYSVAGSTARINFCISKQIEEFSLYKFESDDWKKIADTNRFKFEYSKKNQTYFLTISNVDISDTGDYRCGFVKEEKDSVTYSSTSRLEVIEGSMVMNDCLVTQGDKAVLTCKYAIKEGVKAVNWYKKTADGMKVIFTSDTSQQKKVEQEKVPERCKVIYKYNETSLKFEKVSLTDAGEYMCGLKTRKDKITRKLKGIKKSAHLHVQCYLTAAFDSEPCSNFRRPAVVIINSHVLVFVEQNNSDVIMRRGRVNGKSLIEWEEKTKLILYENDTSFQNLVPLMTNEKMGKLILMCVRQDNNTKERKIIRMKSDDNGANWTGPEDVQLDLKGFPGVSLSLGDGACLNLGLLIVAGVWSWTNVERIEKSLVVITSTNNGDTWDIVTDVKPPAATLGEHTQVVEYADNRVYISCSLENSKQRFHVYSDKGFKSFDVRDEDAMLKLNPECQGGIVRLPTKTDDFYQIAIASHGNKTNDLTLHLSKDGCKTWSQFNTLGAVNAEESDLAYYSVKEGKKEAEGIVCVYSYGSETKGYNIGMQLISKQEIIIKKREIVQAESMASFDDYLK